MACTRNDLLKPPGATFFEPFFQEKTEEVLTDVLCNIHVHFLHRLGCGTALILLTYHLLLVAEYDIMILLHLVFRATDHELLLKSLRIRLSGTMHHLL